MTDAGFTFRTSPEITFGTGVARGAPGLAARFGRRALVVTGGSSLERSGMLARVVQELEGAGTPATLLRVTGEPEVTVVDDAARLCRDARCDVVLAIGGGSVLDTAKAVAALATNDGAAVDYLEGLNAKPRGVDRAPLPVVAVPSTAGSGSEVTRNSVLRVAAARVKRSMRSDALTPRVAVVDPQLSATAPLPVAASAGLDALTHLIEAYVSRGAQPMTDLVALAGIGRAAFALQRLALGAATAEEHAAMALASLWGGLALANAGLGATHGLVAVLGGRYPVPHGAGCGCLLAATVRTNVAALRSRAPESPALGRYAAISRAVVGREDAGVDECADALDRLRESLGIGTLARYGVRADDLASVIEQSRAGSMRSNPIDLTDGELDTILRASLGSVAAATASPAT